MFANLKNKLIEEVKASPSKFQQFANAAQAAVSSTSSTSVGSESTSGNENFFSITEEDTPHNSPQKTFKIPIRPKAASNPSPQSSNGAIPRTRKLSNSSVASDLSLRLPSYEASSVYHLQSDLDASASELDDSASTARLDVVNKEQLFQAYKKALDRYQKYRLRYGDLAKKYKDLERDSTKARAVLLETQEKAIRRISELREQCTLEQQAKAHLEEALRMEMDDMHCKMQAYQTKLKLLGENPENINSFVKSEPLIDLTNPVNNSSEARNLINLDADQNHIGDAVRPSDVENQLKGELAKIEDLNTRLQEANNTINLLKKQEAENALSLAQAKQAIYSELESKENQVKLLKANLVELEEKMNQVTRDNTQQSSEQLAEINDLKEKLKATTLTMQEAEAKAISLNHNQTELKQHVLKVNQESEEKLRFLRQQNEEAREVIREYHKSEIAIAEVDNELNRMKTENNELRQATEDNQRRTHEIQTELNDKVKKLEEIQKEKNVLQSAHKDLEDRLQTLSNEIEVSRKEKDDSLVKIKDLKTELETLHKERDMNESEIVNSLKQDLEKTQSELNERIEFMSKTLSEKQSELSASNDKVKAMELELKAQEEHVKENERLKQSITEFETKLSNHQVENDQRMADMGKENSDLKDQVTNILKEIRNMEEEMQRVRASHTELEKEKEALEIKIETMTKNSQETECSTQRWNDELTQSKDRQELLEKKLSQSESENSKLAEKIVELEHQCRELEKGLDDHIGAKERESRLSEEAVQNLKDELTSVSDANELTLKSHALLQDQYKILEDENNKAQETIKCLREELHAFTENANLLKAENTNLNSITENLTKDLDEALKKFQEEERQFTEVNADLLRIQKEKEELEEQLSTATNEITTLKTSKDLLVRDLEKNLSESKCADEEHIKHLECKIQELTVELDKCRVDLTNFHEATNQHDILKKKLLELQQQLQSAQNQIQETEEKHQIELSEILAEKESQLTAVKTSLQAAEDHINQLTESNERFQSEIANITEASKSHKEELDLQLQKYNTDSERFLELEKKLQNYDQLQLENEYLNNLKEQLQADIRKQCEDSANVAQEISALKEKINSQQCELYVLNENQQKHASEIETKVMEHQALQEEIENLNKCIEKESAEFLQQKEHTRFITEQSDNVHKELLSCQLKIVSLEKELAELKSACEDVTAEKLKVIDQLSSKEANSKNQIDMLRNELNRNEVIMQTLNKEIADLKNEVKCAQELKNENHDLLQQIESLKVELTEKSVPKHVESLTESAKASQHESENLRKINKELQEELEDIQYKSKGQIANLTEEIDDLLSNKKYLNEKLSEHEEMQKKKEELENKLKTTMHDMQDVSTRNTFLEQKCENYLILEQSNERLKLHNEKLVRQLDEALASMHHNDGLSANTEFEYLKNIMFQYLTGTVNGNNETLVKVISAVLKFSPQQTQVALEKEHQRRSLIGQLNNLL